MKFKKIKINNFLALHDVTFDFPSGLVLIDGWNHDLNSHNGVGKSALLNAICYAIYGKTPQNISLSSLIKEGSDGVTTEIELEIDNQNIRILRKRGDKTGKVKLFINNEPQKGMSKNIEEKILNLIQLTFDQFIQVVYIFQDSANRFVDLNDTEKKKFLSTVLNLEIYDDAYKLAHNELSAKNLEESNVAGQITGLKNELERIKLQLEQYNVQLQQFNTSYDEIIKSNNDDIKRNQSKLDELNGSKSNDSTQLLSQLNSQKAALINKINAVQSAKTEQRTIDLKRQNIKREKDKIAKDLEFLNSNICPTCDRTWTTPDAKLKKENFDAQFKTLDTQYANHCIAFTEYQKIIDQIDELKLNTDYEAIMQQINTLSESKNKISFEIQITEQKIASLQQNLTNKHNEAQMIQKNIQDLVSTEQEVLAKLQQCESMGVDIVKQKQELHEIKNIFSPKGIRAYVFNNILNQFNEVIANYLSPLTGGLFTFEMRVDEEKGKIYDYLEYSGQERNFNSLSGGERKRISLAVDLALSNIICSRLAIFPNILFIDEGFNGLDVLGRQTMMQLLTNMSKTKDIYVVDHISEFKSSFCSVFKLIKQNGSTIVS